MYCLSYACISKYISKKFGLIQLLVKHAWIYCSCKPHGEVGAPYQFVCLVYLHARDHTASMYT